MRYHEFTAMNTSILLAAEGETSRVSLGFSAVERQVRNYEERFTRFQESSELSALNRSSGEWFMATPALYSILTLAEELYTTTGGLFNPGILSALEQAGYDRSMDQIRANGGVSFSASAAVPVAERCFGELQFDAVRRAVRLPAGLRIDLGGIAKGWIAEQAASQLHSYSTACAVNAGGDMFACGVPHGDNAWAVGLEDPFHPDHDLAVLRCGPGAVATSTITRRRWQQGSLHQHHLIDPRTGYPANPFWVSVTVIAEHAAPAEALAKALLIGGPDAAANLRARHPKTAFIAVDPHGHLFGSDNSRRYLNGNNL